jgi:hypothetical protein
MSGEVGNAAHPRWRRSRPCGVGIILGALMFAGCHSSPHESLSQYQRAVNTAQTVVTDDREAVNSEQAYLSIPCGSDLSTNPCQPGNTYKTLDRDEAKLAAAESELHVAQDRLEKKTGPAIAPYHPPTTQPVDCGALPVGPGAGPPPAGCSGQP